MKNKERNKINNELIIRPIFQLYYYYNFRRKIIFLLENGNKNNINSNAEESSIDLEFKKIELNKYSEDIFCLIDKNWISNWKKYIGYSDIYNIFKNKTIERKDFENIKPIIERNILRKSILPLDMSKIYKNKMLDIYSNFDIFLIKYIVHFIPNKLEYKEIFKCYPTMISNNKYIIKIDDNTYQISFKEQISKCYYNILIIFKEFNDEKTKIIKEFEDEDINIWLKNNEFLINSDTDKIIKKYNCEYIIINKTLKLRKEKYKVKNSMNPNNPQFNEFIKSDKIPDKFKTIIKENFLRSKRLYGTLQEKSIFGKNNEINYISNDLNDINVNVENILTSNQDKVILRTGKKKETSENNLENKNKSNNDINNNTNNNKNEHINSDTKIMLKEFKDKKNEENNNYGTKAILNNINDINNFNNLGGKNDYDYIYSKINNNYNNNQNNDNFIINQNNQMNYFNPQFQNYNKDINNYGIMNNNMDMNINNNEYQYSPNNGLFFQMNNNQYNNFYNGQNNIPCFNNNINNNNIINNINNNNVNNNNINNNNNNNLNENFMNNMNNINNMNMNEIVNNNMNNNMNFFLQYNNMNEQNFINNYNMNFFQNGKIDLPYPHMKGLQNLGQTCYMNSVIQCFSNIKEITDYLMTNHDMLNVDYYPLSVVYYNLLIIIFLTPTQNINPQNFKNMVGVLNPLFQGYLPRDSKDLLFFLIERLHNELKPKNISNQNIDFDEIEKDCLNEEKMLQNFQNEFKNSGESIISKTFYGIIRSKMICDKCKLTKYSFQTFNMQIFQLKKLKYDKIKKEGNTFDKLSLIDAFNYLSNEEILDGENMIYCNKCHQLTIGRISQNIYRLPNILIIVLNRGKNNSDFNEEFDFPEYLDFNSDFNDKNIIIDQQSKKKYYLMSVIKHIGESGSNGHFIAYVRKNNSKTKFLCYNDSFVNEVNTEDAMKYKISNKEEEKITPYILFYHYYNKNKKILNNN